MLCVTRQRALQSKDGADNAATCPGANSEICGDEL